MIRACMFDLDGTLADTLETLAYFTNLVLSEEGLAPIETEAYKKLVGDGLFELMHRALLRSGAEADEERCERLSERFRQLYFADVLNRTRVYSGMPEALSRLKEMGLTLTVLSNKPDPAAQQVVRELFGEGTFALVSGNKAGVPRKPAPDGALMQAAALGIAPQEFLYIGDTDTDMQTGNAAGMHTVGVLWGFRDEKELRENGAEYLAERPEDIAELVKRLNQCKNN